MRHSTQIVLPRMQFASKGEDAAVASVTDFNDGTDIHVEYTRGNSSGFTCARIIGSS